MHVFVVRRLSQFLSKTDEKSEKCAVLKPLVSTVRPLQKDNGQGANLDQRADACSSEQLHSAPKRRKTCRMQNTTSPISMSRVMSPADKSLLNSMSALGLTANSMLIQMFLKSRRFIFTCSFIGQKKTFFFFEGRKCVTTSLLKQAPGPSTPEVLADRNDSILRHPSPTDSPSPLPWESPNTNRRLKVRSYMSPTTSSRAKISRSMSHKEGLHLNLSSGQTSPCPGSSPSSPFHASSLLQSLSAPLPGPCNPAVPRLSYGGCSPNPTAKITKARVSARMSNPLSEYPSRSTPTPSTDSAALSNNVTKTGVQHGDKCYTKGQVEPTKNVFPIPVSQSVSVKDSLSPKTSAHTPQHPLVDVQAYSVACKSQSDQGWSYLFSHYSGICTVSVYYYDLLLLNVSF